MSFTSPAVPGAQLARQIALLPLVGLIFFSVSGGAYSLEALISTSGPGMGILLLVVMPLVYGLPIAAITTELATAMPAEGGTYVWARRALGDFAAFQAGVLRWLNSWVDMAIYPVLFASYLSALFVPAEAGHTVIASFGPFVLDVHWIVGVVCVIIPMAGLNIRGAKSVGESSLLFAVIALAPLAILAGFGIVKLITDQTNPLSPFMVDGSSATAAFGAGLALVMWSYCGFDRVGLIAGEIKNPTRVIPKAMFIAMIVVIASYVLPLVGSMAVGGWESWEAGSFGDIGERLGGTWLAVLVTVGGMFAAIGLYSSLLMSNSRSIFVLATDRWAPPVFTKISPRFGTPVVAIVVSSVMYALFSLGSFIDLVVIDVFLINLLLLVNLIALVALRIKEPTMPRPAKIPGGWLGIAAMGVPLTVVICYVTWYTVRDYGSISYWLIGGTLVLSVLVYFPARTYQQHHSSSADAVALSDR
ncbi:APC family permease [Mycolicibacterium sp. P9-22]|uniref:APC family permease n=1 Tax=Mycolicibacterium sp. P9-22 TaxID=2024613 RepID=UPI0011EDD226|nr:APC family permease [Mycolicibacterium sp. P9-22]KAA0111012.1 APC family permease [Mycolicibacterium sp. P9-22]